MTAIDRRLSVAPMLNWTDRHCRYFHRLLAPNALLYTEMVTTGALIYGDRDRHLQFSPQEQPVALQLGGSNPDDLARAAKMAERYGYCEVNLNIGCPSPRVQAGSFGACLMKEPQLVCDCIDAMRAAVALPITVKTRIGVDECDSEAFFIDFCQQVIQAGASALIVHARKAWLQGLSPKENREIPPLDYSRVAVLKQTLKQQNAHVPVTINGGIDDIGSAAALLNTFDGVMIGRAAYSAPYFLAQLEQHIFATAPANRHQVVEQMAVYSQAHIDTGGTLAQVSRHMLGLFNGCGGAKNWRRILSEHAHKANSHADLLKQALSQIK